jgi:hypothetical protein
MIPLIRNALIQQTHKNRKYIGARAGVVGTSRKEE